MIIQNGVDIASIYTYLYCQHLHLLLSQRMLAQLFTSTAALALVTLSSTVAVGSSCSGFIHYTCAATLEILHPLIDFSMNHMVLTILCHNPMMNFTRWHTFSPQKRNDRPCSFLMHADRGVAVLFKCSLVCSVQNDDFVQRCYHQCSLLLCKFPMFSKIHRMGSHLAVNF